MRIVIDARMLYWTGVGRYTKALLDELAEIDTVNEYVVLVRPADRELWEPVRENFRRVEVDINPYSLGEQLRLPGVIRGLAPDLVHFTTPNTPALYQGKTVVTVHDLTLLDYDTSRGTGWKRVVRGLKRLPFRLVIWRAVWGAARVVTPTEYVRRQIVKRFWIGEGRVRAILLAVDPQLQEPESIEKFSTGDEFLLYVGNFYPYKNVGSTLKALKTLAGRYPDLKLVVVGKADYFRDVLETQAGELGLSDRVVFTGFVTDGELISLYKKAKLYVYPSLSEGFGLQGLEAMTQGLPVLAANASCLPEVYGQAAVYFDPRSSKDQASKIADVLASEGMREKLRTAGHERIKAFSWRKMAEETLDTYQKAAK